ncbi:MAG: hypothetical protein Q8Q08_00730 [Candidatus Omnitrophota bacterium]|nr:hypothetical protein [Candidatus Omnitrophota bacterium]MDZ4242053.1 hypothetical protein [Candidatus Omnitrophota bacterium]
MTDQHGADEIYLHALEKYSGYCAYCRFDFLKDTEAFLKTGFDNIAVGQVGHVSHLIPACPACRSLNPVALAPEGSSGKDAQAVREFVARWQYYDMRQKHRGT